MVRDIEDRLRVDSGHDRRQVLDAFQSWSGNLAVLHQVRSVAGKLLLWCRIRPEWWNRRLAGRPGADAVLAERKTPLSHGIAARAGPDR
ncbi:hypothetical protein ACWDNI_16605 [Nocardia niigatensis]